MAKPEVIVNISKVILLAVSFAFVEAAVVIYLRHLLGTSVPTVKRRRPCVIADVKR